RPRARYRPRRPRHRVPPEVPVDLASAFHFTARSVDSRNCRGCGTLGLIAARRVRPRPTMPRRRPNARGRKDVSGEWCDGATWPVGLSEVAANTVAYVQAPGSAGISNAGVVLGPDRAVVVDALTTNPMALTFLGKLRRVTPLPISHLLLTHHHVDHFL